MESKLIKQHEEAISEDIVFMANIPVIANKTVDVSGKKQ